MIRANSIFYQLVTDRFDNDAGDLSQLRNSPDYETKFGSYMGGTFKGIERHIDHLEKLGVTHLLISPVEENFGDNAYHGYHPNRPLAINPRFGTPADLKRLVKRLRERNIGTVLDYVSAHISKESPFFEEKMSEDSGRLWFATKDLLDSPFFRDFYESLAFKLTDGGTKRLEDVNQSPDYLGYFGLSELPLFNLQHPEVIAWHIRRIKHLVRDYGFSDVRLDSGFIHPRETIRRFREGLREIEGEPVMLLAEYWPYYGATTGECYGFADGEIDVISTMLFNQYGENPAAIWGIREQVMRAKDLAQARFRLVAGLANHDLPRFKGDEQMQKIAAVLNFTLPIFTPTIYYGEEVRLDTINSGNDRLAVSRDIMDFSREKTLTYFYERLAKVRLSFGDETPMITNFQINDTDNRTRPEQQLISYTLRFRDQTYHIVCNRDSRQKPVDLSLLLADEEVIPYNLLTESLLDKVDEKRYMIKERQAYIFRGQ